MDSNSTLNRTLSQLSVASNSNRGVVVISVTGKPKVPEKPSGHDGLSNQGMATLVVMCCVLGIIMMFCCLAAPGIRDLCKRYVFRQCVIDDPEVNNVWNRSQIIENQHKIVNEKRESQKRRRSSSRYSNNERRQSRRQSRNGSP